MRILYKAGAGLSTIFWTCDRKNFCANCRKKSLTSHRYCTIIGANRPAQFKNICVNCRKKTLTTPSGCAIMARRDLRVFKKFCSLVQKRLDKSRFRTHTGAGDTLRKSSSYYYWRPRAKNENNSHLRIVLICESFSFANRSHLRIVLIWE